MWLKIIYIRKKSVYGINKYKLQEVLKNEKNFSTKKRQTQKEHGFMKRMKTRAGRNVLKARRAKGRNKISA